MLYYLQNAVEWFSPLRIFQYITVRTFGAAGTAFVLSLLLGPGLIRRLKLLKLRQQFREDAVLKDHLSKAGTPTMGGLLILFTTVLATLLWAQPGNSFVLVALATLCFMGTVGFLDDYLKIRGHSAAGLSGPRKLALQAVWTAAVLCWLWQEPLMRERVQQLYLPFLKNPVVPAMGLVFSGVFIFIVLLGSSNAVNLTDGLDGLAIGCTNSAVLAYLVMAYAAGHYHFAEYLQIPFLPGGGELTVFCGALLGAGLGFLWFNAHPAKMFMGDTGSLAIGGALAIVAVLIKQELVLVIVGGVFVVEALSVMLQRGWFKYTRRKYGEGRRIFLCAPLHHHFERLEVLRAEQEGRCAQNIESRIVTRFCIMAIIFALLGVATLKIR